MSLIDYKTKYLNLKATFQNTVDLSWRLGYEQGMQQAQTDQIQQQSQQADAMAQQQNQGQMALPHEHDETETESPASNNPNDDELGQHIEKLEGMISKSELSSLDVQDLKKTLNDIKTLHVSINLSKSMDAVKHAKMGHKHQPLVITPKLQANLSEPAKRALTMQEQIVSDVFKKWEADSAQTKSGISAILGIENLIKKD